MTSLILCISFHNNFQESGKRSELLSRSGIPEEIKIVPLGPNLSPGVLDEDAAVKVREKLDIRGLLVAMTTSTDSTYAESKQN